jgi:hypothetical protein
LILTCGQIVLLVVNVICEDFAGLTVILHCSIQFWSRLRCCVAFYVSAQRTIFKCTKITLVQLLPPRALWLCCGPWGSGSALLEVDFSLGPVWGSHGGVRETLCWVLGHPVLSNKHMFHFAGVDHSSKAGNQPFPSLIIRDLTTIQVNLFSQ